MAQLLLKRFEQYRLRDVCALLVVDQKDEQDLRTARAYGVSKRRLAEFFRTSDLLWNFAAGVRPPRLSLFRHRVLMDGDPGHLQILTFLWASQSPQTFTLSANTGRILKGARPADLPSSSVGDNPAGSGAR